MSIFSRYDFIHRTFSPVTGLITYEKQQLFEISSIFRLKVCETRNYCNACPLLVINKNIVPLMKSVRNTRTSSSLTLTYTSHAKHPHIYTHRFHCNFAGLSNNHDELTVTHKPTSSKPNKPHFSKHTHTFWWYSAEIHLSEGLLWCLSYLDHWRNGAHVVCVCVSYLQAEVNARDRYSSIWWVTLNDTWLDIKGAISHQSAHSTFPLWCCSFTHHPSY